MENLNKTFYVEIVNNKKESDLKVRYQYVKLLKNVKQDFASKDSVSGNILFKPNKKNSDDNNNQKCYNQAKLICDDMLCFTINSKLISIKEFVQTLLKNSKKLNCKIAIYYKDDIKNKFSKLNECENKEF